MKKLIAGAALAVAALGGSIATGGTAEAGVTGCSATVFQMSGGASAGTSSYCSYTSSNTLRHRARVSCSNGVTYYGAYRNGGQYSFANCPYGYSALSGGYGLG